jgi:hypothetical protein
MYGMIHQRNFPPESKCQGLNLDWITIRLSNASVWRPESVQFCRYGPVYEKQAIINPALLALRCSTQGFMVGGRAEGQILDRVISPNFFALETGGYTWSSFNCLQMPMTSVTIWRSIYSILSSYLFRKPEQTLHIEIYALAAWSESSEISVREKRGSRPGSHVPFI